MKNCLFHGFLPSVVGAVASLGGAIPAQDPDPTASATASWSQWRGPSRSGHVAGADWPAKVDDEHLVRRWRVELADSYSGPIVDAERVFTTETVDREREVVRAFDRETGEELWQVSWPGAMTVPFFAAKNGSWVRSTPALDDGRLYVAGMRDVLVCLDAASGDEVWRVDFVERFQAPLPDFGFVCSPLVVGDHVYVQAGASFVKLHKETGETVWRTLEDGGGMFGSAFSSPVMAEIHGEAQLLVQGREALAGVRPADGEVLWQVRVRTFRGMNILTPQPVGESSVFTSAYGGRAHLFDIGHADGVWSVEERWNNRAQGYMTSPVVIDHYAYLFLRNKRFTCVDLETGEQAWLSEPCGDEYWSLVVQGDRLLALTETGELLLIAHDPSEFRVLDQRSVSDDPTWAHVTVDAGQVLIREQNALSVFDWTSGSDR